MLSGVGDANHLKERGINVVHNLKGVGKNLQDHLETYIQQECKTRDTLYTYTKLIPKVLAGIQWFLSKSGPCSQSYLEAGGFAKSSPEREIANIQFHFFPSFVIDHGLVNPKLHMVISCMQAQIIQRAEGQLLLIHRIHMIILKYYLIT